MIAFFESLLELLRTKVVRCFSSYLRYWLLLDFNLLCIYLLDLSPIGSVNN